MDAACSFGIFERFAVLAFLDDLQFCIFGTEFVDTVYGFGINAIFETAFAVLAYITRHSY